MNYQASRRYLERLSFSGTVLSLWHLWALGTENKRERAVLRLRVLRSLSHTDPGGPSAFLWTISLF